MASEDIKSTWEEKIEFYLESATGEINHDFDSAIICNSKHIVVTISPDTFKEGRVARFLHKYSQADDDDEVGLADIETQILDIIYSAGWRKFENIAPNIQQDPDQPINPIGFAENLDLDLNREACNFKLVEMEGREGLVEFHPAKPGLPLLFGGDDPLILRRHSSRDIKTICKLPSTVFIAKVSLLETIMCCRIATTTSLKAV